MARPGMVRFGWASWRRGALAPLVAGAALGMGGCATSWDRMTSRDFEFAELFVKPDPLFTLRDSKDGDRRAAAFKALREPLQHKGTEDEQEAVVKILVTGASSEPQPLCRLAAIQTLGTFKDPRAVQGLTDAYFSANSYPPETATVVKSAVMLALGETKNPTAVKLLAQVVREPPAEGDEVARQQSLDVRISAARALARFNHPEGNAALVRVLQAERDVALRNRAHASLQACTGQKLPPDGKAWEEWLRRSEEQGPSDEKKGKWLGILPVGHREGQP